jgi:hypothetical protein
MRYLVRARVRPGGEHSLLEAIEHRTLGKGSVAGGEYLRNMQDARLCLDGTARVRFLRQNQYQDGSWLVKTRSYPTQPYFETGYPFGNNQFISAGAASWSALAIAYTLPDAEPPAAR